MAAHTGIYKCSLRGPQVLEFDKHLSYFPFIITLGERQDKAITFFYKWGWGWGWRNASEPPDSLPMIDWSGILGRRLSILSSEISTDCQEGQDGNQSGELVWIGVGGCEVGDLGCLEVWNSQLWAVSCLLSQRGGFLPVFSVLICLSWKSVFEGLSGLK